MDNASDANAMRLIRTTVALEEQARKLARRLIEARRACCVHIQRIESVYRWNEAVEEASEWMVEARVPAADAERCWLAMSKDHPYVVPMVEMLSEGRVNGAYARWAADVMQSP